MVEGIVAQDLDMCFQNLVMVGVEGGGKMMMNNWKDLPMELLLRILSLVDDRTVIVASGVCTGWRDAVCLGLVSLNISWCKNNMNNLLLSLAPKFTKLQTLSLRQSTPQLEDNSIEAIASWCHDLTDLDLSKSLKLTDSSLYAVAHCCPLLTKLNISGCPTFGDAALAYLTSFCKNLKSLNLCGCVKAASDRALQAISYNCSQMQYLNLGWCDSVTDAGVTSLAFGCPDLRSLDLCGCVLITDESVIALASKCIHLRSLGLYYCQNITDKAMYSLANSRSKSSTVKRDNDLWESVKSSSTSSNSSQSRYKNDEEGLEKLNISQCTALTPPAVQAVCDSFPSLHTCAGRHSLIISGCLNLTSVHCLCALQARRVATSNLTSHPHAH
ncbi:hypothetical protein C5167_013326 [Papaver somniferum]|uniref:Uncharacterized protein n=1 Tax=Papaver somniferum TaxID=3469 RepID=A0A4Y7J409_PAPSO|nr:F-box protein SKP2A-like isoform X1 [Papaver somniferum]RZC54469.1 hypothetical protein C5167_013326 [Papaver somniferum]